MYDPGTGRIPNVDIEGGCYSVNLTDPLSERDLCTALVIIKRISFPLSNEVCAN